MNDRPIGLRALAEIFPVPSWGEYDLAQLEHSKQPRSPACVMNNEQHDWTPPCCCMVVTGPDRQSYRRDRCRQPDLLPVFGDEHILFVCLLGV